MTSVRSMSTKPWDEIYGLVGRIQHRAIESRDWQVAKDADIIPALLQKCPSRNPAAGAEDDSVIS
jgi:hypothetical protein